MKILGHASFSTTMDTYVHVTDESLENAMQIFANGIAKKSNNGKIYEVMWALGSKKIIKKFFELVHASQTKVLKPLKIMES